MANRVIAAIENWKKCFDEKVTTKEKAERLRKAFEAEFVTYYESQNPKLLTLMENDDSLTQDEKQTIYSLIGNGQNTFNALQLHEKYVILFLYVELKKSDLINLGKIQD